jgi:hypothetical protein
VRFFEMIVRAKPEGTAAMHDQAVDFAGRMLTNLGKP